MMYHLLDVQNFVARGGIRVMELKWIDWYDLGRLLTPGMLRLARKRAGDERWTYLNGVIVTAGAHQPRIKPGIAIAVLRDGLSARWALHREGIVHGDVEPSNIMLGYRLRAVNVESPDDVQPRPCFLVQS
jgi:eukaryotic-like serine/threonine-protein kinase